MMLTSESPILDFSRLLHVYSEETFKSNYFKSSPFCDRKCCNQITASMGWSIRSTFLVEGETSL